MTELQKMYAALREEGYRHHQTIDRLATRVGVDRETVTRVLARGAASHGKPRNRKG